jgi:NTP pyrophosphatase (non-canonical NTP hydrolase)
MSSVAAEPRPRAPARGGQASGSAASTDALRVVLCGSFRRDPEALKEAFAELSQHYEVLSPISLEFVDPDAEFVRLPHELTQPESVVEARHLDALHAADFVWLFAPNGYIGTSATFELGHAHALGIPIFSDTAPSEPMFASWVTVVDGPAEVNVTQGVVEPGNGLRALQLYYERTAKRRGWADESAQDTLLLLTEEIGELARAVRKAAGIARDGDWEGQDAGEELADVQLYLVHLATILGVDLANAVTAKERVNADRVAKRGAA